MRPIRTGVSTAHVAFIVGTLALAGCVPSAYVYDHPQDGYSGSGYGYYSTVRPGYYAQQGYYRRPGYYGQTGYPPRVVYYDHDYDGDRNDPGHDGHDRHDGSYDDDRQDGRHDRDRQDGDATRPPPHRPPPSGVTPVRPVPPAVRPQGSGRSPQVPHGRNPCAGNKKCGPSGEASDVQTTRDRDEPRTSTRQDNERRAGSRPVPK